MILQTSSIGGTSASAHVREEMFLKSAQVGEGIWETLPAFGESFVKSFLLKMGYVLTF